ncbi:RNA polymerase sigma factor [Microbacterium sp. 2FI]|uniref:RNA polymerase sigma factor n=1 Tax=Microbacterium sp. 2FI TaxID=2502193 RepID=UPI0010F81BA0|nr:RNA polymerase sigma factor [Microbacterium sp. 2FI]
MLDRFEELFRSQHGDVRRYVVRLVGSAPADDIVASTFELALLKLPHRHAHPVGWLFRTAHNLCRAEVRRQVRENRAVRDAVVIADTDADDYAIDVLLRLLAALPAAQREVLQLTYWDRLSAADVGVVLGEPGDGMSVRAQTDLDRLRDGRFTVPARPARRFPPVGAWAASAIAIGAVAVVVLGVPVIAGIAGIGRTPPPVTAGVPTSGASPEAFGTFESPDGSTRGRVAVHVDGDSITAEIVDLVTTHDELTASGSLSSREDRSCLDDGTDVEFGAFPTAGQKYIWLIEGNSMPADWTALHEIDLAVIAPGGRPAECVTTIVARAVLDW